MEPVERQSVVRLSPRGDTTSPAPRLTPPRRRIVIRSAPLREPMHSPRVLQRREIKATLSARSPAHRIRSRRRFFVRNFWSKFASLVLIPMIFLHPILPVYAADESVADAPPPPLTSESAGDTTTPQTGDVASTPPLSGDSSPSAEGGATEASAGDTGLTENESSTNSTEAESMATPSEMSSATDAETENNPPPDDGGPPPSSEESGVAPAEEPGNTVVDSAGEAEQPSDVGIHPDESLPPSEGGGSGGGSSSQVPPAENGNGTAVPVVDATSATTSGNVVVTDGNSTAPDEVATTTEEGVATTTDESAVSTTDEEVTEEEAPPIPSGPSDEEIRAEAERKQALLRAELRREVEEEFLRGCISFEASGYYCLNDDARTKGSHEVKKEEKTTVSAEVVGGGDKEVVVRKGSENIVITENDWDDAFPTQDITGNAFVWQGMKNGRWQIFTATMEGTSTPPVEQVTESTDSNFNPKIDGDHIVWQAWANENWEIVLATRRATSSPFASEKLPDENRLFHVGPEWELTRLTDNDTHDMFPSIHGDIVTWQAHEGDTWVVYAYSISQRTKTKLSGDGAKSEHPRFAITWEERDAQGNSRLMSYDMATGEKIDLTSEARRSSDNPYKAPPPTPIASHDQATLPPAGGTGTSTPSRSEDDTSPDNTLPV